MKNLLMIFQKVIFSGTLLLVNLESSVMGFPGGSDSKESACTDPGSIPGLGRSLGDGNGNPLYYSCLENSMNRGAWRATVHVVPTSQTLLSTHTLYKFKVYSVMI